MTGFYGQKSNAMEKTEEVETKEKAQSGDSAVMGELSREKTQKFQGNSLSTLILLGHLRDRGLRQLCFGMAFQYQQLEPENTN